jgi:hypothetical protein
VKWKDPLKLTYRSDNLGLQPELGLKAIGKIAHPTFTVAGDVRDFSDMIEHMTTSEEKDRD